MADSKITALTALTAADPANDMLPVVDVSDTSMAASGTTKRISINNLLACSPSATLASATITGALGAAGLNVTGATIPANGVYLGSANNLSFSYASTLGMTLNSTGLGVGVASPAAKLDVAGNAALTGTSGFKYLYFNLATDTNSVRGAKIGKNYDSTYDLNIHATTAASGGGNEAAIKFFRNNTDVSMTLDSSGNVGIGVTPVNKLTIGTGTFNASTVSGSASLYATVSQGLVVLADGLAVATRGGVNRLIANSAGDIISSVTGTAPSLTDNGYMVFNLTSNTNLRVSVRGTDGVTRTANLTLT